MNGNGAPAAVLDAADLRKRVIRLAYALHFAAGHTATLFEQYAELVPPQRDNDDPRNSDRWRSLAEHALEMARACDRRTSMADGPNEDATCWQVSRSDASGHLDILALSDLATRHLSAAAVNLEALLPLVDRPLRGQLEGAVDHIDETISTLRV